MFDAFLQRRRLLLKAAFLFTKAYPHTQRLRDFTVAGNMLRSARFNHGFMILLAMSSVLDFVYSAERDDAIVGYDEMDRTFIVIGATGAGKSTFINSLVHKSTMTMPMNSGASPSSQTKEVQQHTTPRYRMSMPFKSADRQKCTVNNPVSCLPNLGPSLSEVGLKVTFFDTIGVDADDVNSKQVFTTLVKAVASEKVRTRTSALSSN